MVSTSLIILHLTCISTSPPVFIWPCWPNEHFTVQWSCIKCYF